MQREQFAYPDSTPRSKYGLPEEVRFCRLCVMSNQRPNSSVEYAHTAESAKITIHFDDEGICDACKVAECKKHINWKERDLQLRELLERHRGKGDKYDVLVPGSGGKDSFYAAHILTHRYGMKPLLVTWAPHLATEWGQRNLERWQEIADHIMVTPSRSTHRLLTRLAVDNLFHPFQPFIIGQKALAPKIAAQYGIPLVFYGENEAEYGNPMADTDTSKRSDVYHTALNRMYLSGVPMEELRVRYGLREVDLNAYMPAKLEELQEKKVEVHYLGYYLKWHPQSCYYYAVENGGFEPNPGRTPGTYSKYNSIDDKIDDLHYYTTFIKFGIGRATYDAAQEIRSGDITREEGMALVKSFDGEYPARFEKEVFEYLSVPGFEPMTRAYLTNLANKFRSDHLWRLVGPYGNWELRHKVWE